MILNRVAFRTLPHPIPHLPQRTGCQADELLLSFVHSFDAPEPGQCGDEVKPELIQHVVCDEGGEFCEYPYDCFNSKTVRYCLQFVYRRYVEQ